MSSPIASMLREAAAVCRKDARRKGNLVALEHNTDILVSGDLHGNRLAMDKIIRTANLSTSPNTRLVLQELIHGLPDPKSGKDRSIDLLVRAARLLLAHPNQVLFLLANHDVAQVTGAEISKAGRGVCKEFADGVQFSFGDDAAGVMEGVNDFLQSLPIAIRCPNKVLLSHSLPAPTRMRPDALSVLDQPYDDPQWRRGGTVYEWTWGRDLRAAQVDALAQKLDVDFVILGHHHSPEGFEVLTPRCVTISSDGDAGCIIRFGAAEPMSAEIAGHKVKFIAQIV